MSDDARDVEAAIDALYQGPLDGFTAARNALAAVLKKRGDTSAAERVKALAKPSVTAWAVNQAWWRSPDTFEALLAAGAGERAAHVARARGQEVNVRAADAARHKAVRAAVDAVVAVFGGSRKVAPDALYRIEGTVQALAVGGVPDGEHAGRLTKDLQSSGLDALSALAGVSPPPRPTVVSRRSSPRDEPASQPDRASAGKAAASPALVAREDEVRVRRRTLAERRVQELESLLAAQEQEAASAAAALARARTAADTAHGRRTRLEEELDEARRADGEARRALTEATSAAGEAAMKHARTARELTAARTLRDEV